MPGAFRMPGPSGCQGLQDARAFRMPGPSMGSELAAEGDVDQSSGKQERGTRADESDHQLKRVDRTPRRAQGGAGQPRRLPKQIANRRKRSLNWAAVSCLNATQRQVMPLVGSQTCLEILGRIYFTRSFRGIDSCKNRLAKWNRSDNWGK